MAQTIGGKLAGMERDCQAMVGYLNATIEYRGASQVQSLLQQIGAVRVQLEQSGDPSVADQEYPVSKP